MSGQVILADAMGFCWGVRRTLRIAEEQASPDDRVATIGDVIHNPHVVERFRLRGLDTAENVDDAARRGFRRVAITAHGASPKRATRARALGMEVVDTTCPLVTKVQRLARKLAEQGYFVVVYGDASHPEVKGILGWADTVRSAAAKHVTDLPWFSDMPLDCGVPRRVAVVSQTTKIVDEFLAFSRELMELLARNGAELRVCNTICAPTTERQNAMKRLVARSDVILVIGGRKSSNTARLVELGRRSGIPTHHVESARDIDDAWLSTEMTVGVSAGASTPDDSIREVVDALVARGFRPPSSLEAYIEVDLDQLPAY
jgi:4-hydroxy-3-methylbut-2-en-1-yl diphosphate reductase